MRVGGGENGCIITCGDGSGGDDGMNTRGACGSGSGGDDGMNTCGGCSIGGNCIGCIAGSCTVGIAGTCIMGIVGISMLPKGVGKLNVFAGPG